MKKKHCIKCGAELEDDSNFCIHCGYKNKDSIFNSNGFKLKILIILVIILILIVSVCSYSLLKQESKIEILGGDSLSSEDDLVFSLSKIDGNPLMRQDVSVYITSNLDGSSKEFNVTTDGSGRGTVSLEGLNEDEYTVKIVYDGSLKYKSSAITKVFKIDKKFNGYPVSGGPTTESPHDDYLRYDGDYKYFTIKIDGVYCTSLLPWDYKENCYHW